MVPDDQMSSGSALKREYSHFYIQMERQIWAVLSLGLNIRTSSFKTGSLEIALGPLYKYWGSILTNTPL
jgi:hypothetical protein